MERMYLLWACAFLVVFTFTFVLSTVDMNIRELQFVADHLTPEDCIQVEAALRQDRFQIDWDQLEIDSNILTEKTNSTPCLVRLLNWDRGKAKHQTFQDLSIRLKELGFVELSDKLSRTVLHEKAEAVQEAFLDDPFKELIPTRSVVQDIPENLKKSKIQPAPYKMDSSHFNFMFWCIIGTLSVISVLLVSCCICCPKAACKIWRQTVPEGSAVGCDMLIFQCTSCCKVFRKDADRHLLDNKDKDKKPTRRRGHRQVPSHLDIENAIKQSRSYT